MVVIGAGYGGLGVALKLLKQQANYTLINPRDCMHHNLAALRAAIEPGKVF